MLAAIDNKHRTGILAALMAVAMVGVGYASVPLYRLFCQVTGFGGTTQRVDEAIALERAVVMNKSMSIRFDSNVSPDLAWEFKPEHPTQTVRIGERNMAIFLAKNVSSRPIIGMATYNVTPTQAGQYFDKIQCFCFNEQRLEPGQEVRMPVLFYVDPKIMDDPDTKDIEEITLSYTFYPSANDPGTAKTLDGQSAGQ